MKSLFSVDRVPFSTFGSWMSISIPRDSEDLFLRNCHTGPHNVFPIKLIVVGEAVEPEITANAWMLALSHGEAKVEICFDGPDTVRMRGKGCQLQLGDRHLIYSEGQGRAVINTRGAYRRYGVEAISGSLDLRRLVETQPVFPLVLVVRPDESGAWDIAIDEFWSTWNKPDSRDAFDSAARKTEEEFAGFLDAMPLVREQDMASRELATYIDWAFTVNPCGLLKRPVMFMSKNWMCNVWSWDQCFNAMAVAHGHPGLAMDQMLVMVDHQDEYGSYPDSVNDQIRHYNFSKPPVHGWTVKELLRLMPERPADDLMETMYLSLSRQADWWMSHRVAGARGQGTKNDARGTGLPYYLHGNDSGWDNSTMFDHGVPLIAPDLSSLLVVQMDVLSELAVDLGKKSESAEWKKRADGLYSDLMDTLWSGDHFVALRADTGDTVECMSLIPWLALIMGERLPADVRESLKAGMEKHLTDWGLATERVDSVCYKSDGYWRGPIWGPSTYIAVCGLDYSGFPDLADEVSEKFCRMGEKSGFPENYDALTGDPLCDPAYTWTASVFLLLAERMKRRKRK